MSKLPLLVACAVSIAVSMFAAGGCGAGGPDPVPGVDGPTSVAARLSIADLFDRGTRSYYDIFLCEAQESGQARVEMQSSDFDTRFLVFERGSDGSYTQIDGNDDSGAGTTNSDDSFTVVRGGTYRILATSAKDRETGAYLIRFSQELGPPAQLQTDDQAASRLKADLATGAKNDARKK